MPLSYTELVELVETGVIDAPLEHVNPCSIDVRLGDTLIFESDELGVVDLSKREMFQSHTVQMNEKGFYLAPGKFVLAHTMETFNLPNDICAEFKLKSTGCLVAPRSRTMRCGNRCQPEKFIESVQSAFTYTRARCKPYQLKEFS